MRARARFTSEHRIGAIDGLNLFFGALLGANLGTLDGLRLVDYVKLIALLAGTVIALRLVSSVGQSRNVLILLGVYAALLASLVLIPGLQPPGLSDADLHRLAATLAIWVGVALAIEFAFSRAEPRDS